jgi:arylsulfatase
MVHDPLELENIAARHGEIVTKLYKDYLAWFKDVSATRGYAPSPIELGGPRENPTVLTRQDWRGPLAGAEPNAMGFWQVNVAQDARFDVTLHFSPRQFPTELSFSLNGAHRKQSLKPGTTEYTFQGVPIKAGSGRFEALVEGNKARAGILNAVVRRIER